jgi:hypothetical protein
MNAGPSNFYVAGGTLRGDAPCYLPRQADADLFDGLVAGEFCYVLTARQMGKSSLMVRTAQRLSEKGVSVVVLDLTAIGQNLTAEQWYDGLLAHVGRQLDLEDALDAFWQANVRLGPLQRWLLAIRDVVLPKRAGPIVIFVDEIDTVRSLPFSTDEFFAMIRSCWNRRPEDPDLARLTFCLLGVATPSDLIGDPRTTPFNVGRRVELRDFAAAEAAPLAQGLGRPPALGASLIERILHWTGGHPYLTQRLCIAVAEDPNATGARGVDRLCGDLFLSHRARERDDNLLFVRERILRSDVDRAGLLDRYDQVLRRKAVRDDETCPFVGILRLSGLTRVERGNLAVRNRIYGKVFDREWVASNMPDAEKRRQKAAFRRGVLRASIVAALLIAAIGAGIYAYFDAYVLENVAYFNTHVKRFGTYEGIGPLSSTAVAHRPVSFRLTRFGRLGPVVNMEAVDGSGKPTIRHRVGNYLRYREDTDGTAEKSPCRWELDFDRSGRVVYEKAYDDNGELVWGFVYSPRFSATGASGHFVDVDGYPRAQRHSSAEYVRIEYDSDGFEKTVRFFDRNGKRQPGPDRAMGTRREFDHRGLPVLSASIDANDKPMLDMAGNSMERRSFDEMGNVLESVALDDEGKPTRVINGYCKTRYARDAYGNLIGYSCFDEEGRPIRDMEGVHRVVYKLGERGNRVETSYLDEKGRPSRNAVGVAGYRTKFDERGHVIASTSVDESGKPMRRKEGYATFADRYDERGNLVEIATFDENGRPVRDDYGYARRTAVFDERGNQIEQTYFDETGKTIRRKDGFARITYKYDERGNRVELAYFDPEFAPTRSKRLIARATMKYDDRGNEIETSYFNETGAPTRSVEGFAKSVQTFDERGNRIELDYFDEAGRLVSVPGGGSRIRFQYDERGNQIENAFFDENGKPMRLKIGFSAVVSKFDRKSRLVERTYFDTAGKPIRNEAGYAKYAIRRDERGNVVEVNYFDASGKPTIRKGGFAKETFAYDERGNQIRQEYFDDESHPVRSDFGAAKYERKYDAYGRMIEESLFDEKGIPLPGRLCTRTRYDAYGSAVVIESFDAEGHSVRGDRGYARLVLQYDSYGERTQEEYFDETGKPCRPKDGDCAKRTFRRNARGNLVEEAFFDEEGNPTRNQLGYARRIYGYDAADRETESRFFDENGKLVRPKGQLYAIALRTFDDHGNLIQTELFDENDRPTINKDGDHKTVGRFNERDRLIEIAHFDTGNRPRLDRDGVHKSVYAVDAFGNRTDVKHFGVDGNLKGNRQGIAHVVARFDEHGRRIETAFFNEKDEPAVDAEGDHRWTAKYDEFGRRSDAAYFDKLDLAHAHPNGVHRWHAVFDDRGKRISLAEYDAKNRKLKSEVVAASVSVDGAGATAGIRRGDVLLRFDGKLVEDAVRFHREVDELRGEDGPHEMLLLRDGTAISVHLPNRFFGATFVNRLVPE